MNQRDRLPPEAEPSQKPDGGSPRTPQESLSRDAVVTPVDVLYRKIVQGVDLPFCAHSTGNYREGRGFSYYREGFDSYCFFISVSGAGEVTYRGMTRRMERGDMIFVSSAIPARVNSMTDDWHFCFVNIAGDYCEQYERLWNEGGLEIIRPQDPTHYLGLVDRISAELKKPYLAGELTVNALVTVLLTDALVERYDSGESDRRGSLYPTWVQEAAAILSERCSEEIRVSDKEALRIIICINEPAGDFIRLAAFDLASVGMEYINTTQFYLNLVVCTVNDFNIRLSKYDKQISTTGIF
jgi:hypothetical protein